MTATVKADTIIRNVAVPRSLLARPDQFGGAAQDDLLRGDLVIRKGRVAGMQATEAPTAPRLVLPKLTEPHVHLDKCHTVDRLANVGGNLHEAIAEQWRDKERWTAEDIRTRAQRGLSELQAAGCVSIRSHVDWSHGQDARTPPQAWHILAELGQEMALDLQLSPLIGVEDLVDPDIADAAAKHTADQSGALGCFVHGQPQREVGIKQAFKSAEKYGLPLDFHVDEGLALGLDGLEMIAETALQTEFQGPILCGHACSLMNFEGDAQKRLIDKMARAGVMVAALPTTNLYLQGRGNGTPDRRGITRIRELQAAGVPVVIGSDNVRDAFCPTGRHDPVASLALAILSAHLDPPLEDHLPMITTNAARAMGRAPVNVDEAQAGDLMIVDVPTASELLAGTTSPRPLNTCLKGAMQ